MYVPYFLPISPCQLTDDEYRNSYPVNICYNSYPYFNDPFYPRTDYQIPKKRSRKEKSIPLKNFLTPKNSPTGTATPESPPTGTTTPESPPTGTTIPWIPFSKNPSPINLSKGGPYGDITKEIESSNKLK